MDLLNCGDMSFSLIEFLIVKNHHKPNSILKGKKYYKPLKSLNLKNKTRKEYNIVSKMLLEYASFEEKYRINCIR